MRQAVADDENLRDADDLDQFLGQPGLVNLLLHGHTHDGRLHRLSSGLLVLSTGSAAVTANARPQEVPNQYQLLTVRPGGVTWHARQYAVGQRRWIGDTRISASGSDWHHHEPHPLQHVHGTFTSDRPEENRHRPADVPDPGRTGSARENEFFDRVVEATRASHPLPLATVIPRPEAGYLRVSQPLPEGGAEQRPVGVIDGDLTDERLQRFVRDVHRQFASADPSVRSELVYSGRPATDELLARARRHGIRLRSFIDYQGLVDLRPLAERQASQLGTDPIYPAQLYVPQRYRLLNGDPDPAARENLLGQVIDWLGVDGARFVMLLGDFGRGKTFLLRELARTLPQHLPGLLPVLVELRSLEKAPSLDELLAQHLVRHEVDSFDLAKLKYMIRSGRLALLFDGFDELELRVGFENAADYLSTLLRAVTERAKVVLTSRTQHFRSTAQVRTALGAQVAALSTSRVAELEDFTEDQIRQFLTRHYGGKRLAACTALAQRLWSATVLTIPEAELTAEVGATLTQLAKRGYTVDQAAHTVGSGTLLVRAPEGAFAFVHQSVMEWLVANSAAQRLRQGEVVDVLAQRTMSPLMLDFLCDLTGHEVARRWAGEMLADPGASTTAKQNALAIGQRLGSRGTAGTGQGGPARPEPRESRPAGRQPARGGPAGYAAGEHRSRRSGPAGGEPDRRPDGRRKPRRRTRQRQPVAPGRAAGCVRARRTPRCP